MKECIIYYQGKELSYKYSESITKTIISLSLKKGDTFELFPFNHFEDEKTDYKGKVLDFHTDLIIVDIKYKLSETWNSSIKSKIEIYLENNITNPQPDSNGIAD